MVLIILVVALAVRLLYIRYAGESLAYAPDSQGYYVQQNFFKQDFIPIFFNEYRTPGYRLITTVMMLVTGYNFPAYATPEFYTRAFPIFYVQTAVGLIGLLFLYATLARLRIPRIYNLAFTGFTGLNIYQFMWERAYLTEAIYIASMAVFLWLFVVLLTKPTWKIGCAFVAVAAFGFLVRPGGVAIPYIFLPLIWIVNRTKKVFTLMAFLVCLYTAVPGIYTAMNVYLYRYPGVSINTDFSVFGRILRNNIPVDAAAKTEPVLCKQVEDYRKNGGDISLPWSFFVYYGNDVYNHINNLRRFNSLVVRAQFLAFTKSVISDIPPAFFDTDIDLVPYVGNTTQGLTKTFFDILTWIVVSIQKTTIMFLALFPLSVIIAIRKPTKTHMFLVGIGLMEIYQLFSSLIFGGAWEFSRHMIVTQTYLFFFCFWWVAKILSWAKTQLT
jgi:hypothetical protein